MNKNLLLIFALFFTTGVFAQETGSSKFRAGAGLVYATEFENAGVSLNGVYSFTDNLEAELALTHIFYKSDERFNVADLNVHYVFYKPVENAKLYGLAGLAMNFSSTNDGGIKNWYTETRAGANIGVGGSYQLSEKLILEPQVVYTAWDYSYWRVGMSVQYRF